MKRALVVCALVAGCGEAKRAEPPAAAGLLRRVLLVTWDTTRSDHLGAYGGKAATPCFDALAARGVLYDHAYATAPITLTSHTSILTGVVPCAHGVRHNIAFDVKPQALLLSEVLHDAGLKTGAFVGSFVLDPKFGLAQGFDVYDAPDTSRATSNWGVVERSAGAVTDAAIRFTDTLAPSDSYFLWVHYYDPHQPFSPPADLLTDGTEPYDAEIASCDRELRRLLDHLRARALDRELITVVTADHGESLGEHGEKTHGIFIYDATMQVPLVIAPAPAGTAPGSRIATRVSNVDVAATLLERLGLSRSAMPEARTAALPVAEIEDDERAIYFECFGNWYSRRWAPLRAIVWKGMKLIEAPRRELFALDADPHETKELSAEQPEVAARLAARLAAFAAENPPLEWGVASSATPEDRQKFEQLGYVSASASNGDGALPADLAALPDPKDRIADLDLRDQALLLLRQGTSLLGIDGVTRPAESPEEQAQRQTQGQAALREARDLLQKLEQMDPGDKSYDAFAPAIELGLGNWAAAAAALEKLGAKEPRVASTHHNLANAYARMGRSEWARREMEKAVALDPKSLFALQWLVQYTMSARDWPAAAWWLDAVIARSGNPPSPTSQLAELTRARSQVQQQLDAKKSVPRAPAPIGDDEFLPEGVRAAAKNPGAGH